MLNKIKRVPTTTVNGENATKNTPENAKYRIPATTNIPVRRLKIESAFLLYNCHLK